jgi:hypothetical protein
VDGTNTVIDGIWWSAIAAGQTTLTGNINAPGTNAVFLDWFGVGGIVDLSTRAGNTPFDPAAPQAQTMPFFQRLTPWRP